MGYPIMITIRHFFFMWLFLAVTFVFWIFSPITYTDPIPCSKDAMFSGHCIPGQDLKGSEFALRGFLRIFDDGVSNQLISPEEASDLCLPGGNTTLDPAEHIQVLFTSNGYQIRVCQSCNIEIAPAKQVGAAGQITDMYYTSGPNACDLLVNNVSLVINSVANLVADWDFIRNKVEGSAFSDFRVIQNRLPGREYPCDSDGFVSVADGLGDIDFYRFCFEGSSEIGRLFVGSWPGDAFIAQCNMFAMTCSKTSINFFSTVVVNISFLSTIITFSRLHSVHRFFRWLTNDPYEDEVDQIRKAMAVPKKNVGGGDNRSVGKPDIQDINDLDVEQVTPRNAKRQSTSMSTSGISLQIPSSTSLSSDYAPASKPQASPRAPSVPPPPPPMPTSSQASADHN